MNRLYIIAIIVASCLIVAFTGITNNNNKEFYYAFNEKIFLTPRENTIIVKYIEGFDKNIEESYVKNGTPETKFKWRNNSIAEITTTSEMTKEALKSILKTKKEVYTCQQLYTLENGPDICIFDEIIVKFLPSTSKKRQNELNSKYETRVIEDCEIFQILRVSKGGDALDIANKYFESGLVEFSKPNFLSNFVPYQVIPNDTYFGNQITCNNTGQTFNDGHSGTIDADIDAPEAWEMTTGSNDIIVAVIDEGVTSDHPDLPNTRQVRLAGSDFADGDADPSPTGNNNHGNSCAGVIGASMNNNQGIAGIAPNCRIMPIRINYSSSTVADFANAIRFAANNGADVISNSWGLNYNGLQPPYSPNLYPEVVTAIQYAVDNGRNNRGCVVLFAVGNNADHTVNNNGYVGFPANVTITGVISVGASDRNDHQANYSPSSNPNHAYNQLVDIVAPSHRAYPCQIQGETFEMWTIDIPNANGYNSWHSTEACMNPPALGEILPTTGTNFLSYTGRFGGTSHSCPVVAGVAALVLSVNPALTYQQVYNLIVGSADQVGGYTYTNGRSVELGYGRVNACRAVFRALSNFSSLSGPDYLCSSSTPYEVNYIPPESTVEWTSSSNISLTSPASSNPCYFQSNGSGSGWVTITITSPCGDSFTLSKNMWVGYPSAPTVYPSTPIYASINSSFSVYITDSPGSSPSTGFWETSGCVSLNGENSGPGASFYSASVNGSGTIYVSTSNECGRYYRTPISVITGSGGGSCGDDEEMMRIQPLAISPNPSSDYIDLIIGNANETSIENFKIEIKDLYSKTVKSIKVNSTRVKIPISDLSIGAYVIVVSNNRTKIEGKFIIQR